MLGFFPNARADARKSPARRLPFFVKAHLKNSQKTVNKFGK